MLAGEPQASKIVFSPAGTDEKIAYDIRREGVTGPVVVDDDPTTISMAIDTLTAVPFGALKALTREGSYDTAGGDIAQQRNGRMRSGHTVTATTGSLITGMAAS